MAHSNKPSKPPKPSSIVAVWSAQSNQSTPPTPTRPSPQSLSVQNSNSNGGRSQLEIYVQEPHTHERIALGLTADRPEESKDGDTKDDHGEVARRHSV
ncbi:MAG: hypothetical protein M1835_007291 [Candelina submexicana]|nr:MAG: hypothetical protein M1835_007291 [Candelina submexicana]